jgi:hypothetical protein
MERSNFEVEITDVGEFNLILQSWTSILSESEYRTWHRVPEGMIVKFILESRARRGCAI